MQFTDAEKLEPEELERRMAAETKVNAHNRAQEASDKKHESDMDWQDFGQKVKKIIAVTLLVAGLVAGFLYFIHAVDSGDWNTVGWISGMALNTLVSFMFGKKSFIPIGDE